MYYSVASNAGIGQSPCPFVGRGFTPAAFFDSRHSLRREPICKQMRPRPTLRFHYNTNRQRKQYLCRNSFVGATIGRPFFVLRLFAGDRRACSDMIAPTKSLNILMRTSLRPPVLLWKRYGISFGAGDSCRACSEIAPTIKLNINPFIKSF